MMNSDAENQNPDKDEILLVDDEPRFLVAMTCALEDDYCLRTAQSGEEALRMVRESCPQLLITDFRMQGMDGLEFMEAMQTEACHPPIILLSGRLTDEMRYRAKQLGAVDCVDKPFDLPDLHSRIRRALNRPPAPPPDFSM